MKVIACLLPVFVLLGCKTYSDDDLDTFDNKIEAYIESENLEMEKLESGLYYKVNEKTKNAPRIKYNDQVTFFYTGRFLDGEVFQVITEEDALTFQVKELIAGWQEGLMQLQGKGSIELIIPPHLGYGSKDTEKIPPNTILHYTLTVTEVK